MKQKLSIVGLGYVGLPLAVLASIKGYEVYGVDTDQEKINKINEKLNPIPDPFLEANFEQSKIIATNNFGVINSSDIIIICVPTPVDESKMPNYEAIESVCNNISKYLKKGQLIILESTVNPGVCEDLIIPLIEKISGLKVGQDLSLAHCPERINPGDMKWDISNIPRIVGGLDAKSSNTAFNFYNSIIDAQVKLMKNLKEAEAVKIVENSFRNINIAFVNELARSFARLNIDVVNVINGASTKPFSFMAHYPSCGIGGHCIPVDPYYLIEYSKKTNGFRHDFLALALKTNEEMHNYTVDLIKNQLKKKNKNIKDSKICVLGLAYKKDINDCRESPAIKIIKILENFSAKVVSYDPHVLSLSTAKTLNEAMSGSDVVLIATDHSEFINLDVDFFKNCLVDSIVDGKNCLKKEEFISSGIDYVGIGR